MQRQRLLPFKRTGKRRPDTAGEHIARVAWLLLRLLHDRSVEYAEYCDRFGLSTRGFQRDLCKLREVGEGYFTISRTKSGRALLTDLHGRLTELGTQSREATSTLARIAAALGGPLQQMLNSALPAGTAAREETGFFHVRAPLPRTGDRVIKTFDFLKGAAAGPALIEFAYLSRGTRTLRRVEPYHVIERSGRYYLIAYDLNRRDWRHFGLDCIEESTLRKAGTFRGRPVPPRFLAERAVGWISANPNRVLERAHEHEVVIRVSSAVAAAVRAVRWQKEQRILALPEGSVQITLTVEDIGEAVRWALQFGAEALVVSPPKAVALARQTAEQMLESYEKLRHTDVARAV